MSKDIITQPDLRLAAEPLITREQFTAKYLADHDVPQR